MLKKLKSLPKITRTDEQTQSSWKINIGLFCTINIGTKIKFLGINLIKEINDIYIGNFIFFHFSFIIHMCIQGLVHFSPLPPPPALPPTPPPQKNGKTTHVDESKELILLK
jgi:cbb3-type cytochrome oxidase subunit 1